MYHLKQAYLPTLRQYLDSHRETPERWQVFRLLWKLSSAAQEIPSLMKVTGITRGDLVMRGGEANIYHSRYNVDGIEMDVAERVIRRDVTDFKAKWVSDYHLTL